MSCHICDKYAEFECEQCGNEVCEDCCVPYTIHEPIDYTLCTECHGSNKDHRAHYYHQKHMKQLAHEKKMAERQKKTDAVRWHVRDETRIIKQLKRNVLGIQHKMSLRKSLAEAFGIVDSMMHQHHTGQKIEINYTDPVVEKWNAQKAIIIQQIQKLETIRREKMTAFRKNGYK